MTTAAIFGPTGFVGSNILSTILGLDAFKAVHTISRRAPSAQGTKLDARVEADNAKWASTLSTVTPRPDVVFASVGTTRAAAGGIANQWKIDHDLNVDIAKAAREQDIKTFVFISSAGTRGMMADRVPYSQMKQGVEDTIKSLDFEQAIIVRPGAILGQREESNKHGSTFIHSLINVFPGFARDRLGQDANIIARAAVNAAILAKEGKAPSKYWILEQSDVVRLGRDEYKL